MGWNDSIIEEFRASGGTTGGSFAPGTLLLLHTTGARSGQPRINPLVFLKEGDRYLIVASKGGAPQHPDWFFNVKANPGVSIEVGTERLDVSATILEPTERAAAYSKLAAKYPFFVDYERQTERVIPVIALEPLSATS